jgi:hypothetical protein
MRKHRRQSVAAGQKTEHNATSSRLVRLWRRTDGDAFGVFGGSLQLYPLFCTAPGATGVAGADKTSSVVGTGDASGGERVREQRGDGM